jgi:hypothetical protein
VFLSRAPRRAVAANALLAGVLAAVPLLFLDARVAADWARVGNPPGLGSGRIWSLAINPANANNAITGTDNGVYTTSDAGVTWAPTPIKGVRVWAVGFDARAPHVEMAALAGGGVRRSEDGGATWSDASVGLTNRNVRALAFGLSAVAAGTADGVFVSEDGKTWRSAGLGGYSISTLAVAANTPAFTLVAGSDGGSAGLQSGFLFRNAGPGPQWETLQQGLPATAVVSAVAAGPVPASTKIRPLVVITNKGTFFSGDGGTTWTSSTGPNADPTNTQPLQLTTAVFSPLDPNLVYAGFDSTGSSGGSLLRSTDSGKTFTDAAKGLSDQQRNIAAIAVATANPPQLLAGIDPASGPSVVVSETDSTAPVPAAIIAEGTAPPPATPTPTASIRATPTPAPTLAAPPDERSWLRRGVDRATNWPIPLAMEVFVVIAAAYLVVRWRQQRFDVEGPP